MPHCMAFGCSNHSGRLPKGIKLFPFPRERNLARQWIIKMGTDVGGIECFLDSVLCDKKADRFRLCSEHFSQDQFKRDMQAELTGSTPKQLLTDAALPSIFVHKQPALPRSSSENVLAKLDKKRKLSRLLNPLPQKRTCSPAMASEPIIDTVEPQQVETGSDISDDNNVVVESSSITTTSTSSQTDWSLSSDIDFTSVRPLIIKRDMAIQWPEFEANFEGDQDKVRRDHCYGVTLTSSPIPSSRKKLFVAPLSPVNEMEEETSIDIPADDSKDLDYEPSFDNNDSDSDLNNSDCSESVHDYVHERKFIVFESCIDSLISKTLCMHTDAIGQICAKPIISVKKCVIGTLLRVTSSCLEGHTSFQWDSQPSVNGMPAGNLLSSAATLFSGTTYSRICQFLGFLGVEFISSSAFYDHQRDYLFPVIDLAWENMQTELLEEIRKRKLDGDETKVCGDGQCDSPGYSAKYCTYTMMDMTSNKVLNFEVVQVTECSSSVAMEKLGFIRCLDYLSKNGIDISVIATDRHPSIAKYMRESMPDIRHQFDVWHFAKSVKKKLHGAAKKRDNLDLSPWEQSISNHLWWSSQTCGGSVILLREKWRSLVHHITNIHMWDGFQEFHHCSHPILTPDQNATKKWLEPGCEAHEALKKIVFDKRLDTDLPKLSEFCHTGSIEVFHSTCTYYRPKRLHFSIKGMVARTALAVLTHNANCNSKHAKVTRQTSVTGEAGELRYKLEFPKSKKQWVAKPIFEETKYDHIYDMLINVLRMREGLLTVEVNEDSARQYPQNIAPVDRPLKSDIVKKHVSRFANNTQN